MQLVLATLQNRPIVYKMIRFDSADPKTRQIVETKYLNAFEDAETAAGDDWAASKAIGITTRDYQVGDIIQYKNGKIFIRTGELTGVIFESSEYTGTLPNISVNQSVLSAIKYKDTDPKIQSIVNGELTWL